MLYYLLYSCWSVEAQVRQQGSQNNEVSSAYLTELTEREEKAQTQGYGIWTKASIWLWDLVSLPSFQLLEVGMCTAHLPHHYHNLLCWSGVWSDSDLRHPSLACTHSCFGKVCQGMSYYGWFQIYRVIRASLLFCGLSDTRCSRGFYQGASSFSNRGLCKLWYYGPCGELQRATIASNCRSC